MRRLFSAIVVVAAIVFAGAGSAIAHPLGNFTVNHLSRITVAHGAVQVRYVLDLAEIPTFELDRSLDPHGTPSRGALQRWANGDAATIARNLELRIDGTAVTLVARSVTVATRPGAGNLPTLYLVARYVAPLPAGAHRLVYADRTEPGRLGWRDVVTGAGREPTAELRAYPSALLGSPRTTTTLAATLDSSGRLTPDARGFVEAAGPPQPSIGRSNGLSDLLQRGASGPLVVIGALLLALALGALHALEPGHGKTLLAVSLVGARATPRQAVVLALALTVAHTAGVLALGLAVFSAAQWIVPEHVYPWITLGSGLLVAIIGARAVAREIRRRLPFAHVHVHAHAHAHPHAHDHAHTPRDHHHGDAGPLDEAHARAHAIPGEAPLTFRSAVVAAASGNVAPCPAALVVLLAAINLHQVAYGLVLIVAFSLGLAALLTMLGIAVVRSAAWLISRPRFDRAARFAPLVTASVIALFGSLMVAQGFVAAGISVPLVLVAGLVLAAIAGYAFAWHGPRAAAHEVHA